MSARVLKNIDALQREPVHPFPARMAPDIAFRAVSRARRQLRVLDPMMGSGTVLVAARAKGHRAIGVDIDPLAVLITKVWSEAIDGFSVLQSAERVLRRARKTFEGLSIHDAYPRRSDAETRKFIRYWFDSCARRQLASLARAIENCRDRATRNVLWCAFSRLIIAKQAGVSRALDLAHSRPHRHFKQAPIDPFATFNNAVERVLRNCLSKKQARRGPAPNVEWGDARSLMIEKGSIDLVLTSPPYLNAIDYMRCSKFSLVWMGWRISELRELRSKSVGTEVGDYASTDSARKLISRLRLKHRLSRRHKAVLARFIADMKISIIEVARVLRPGGKAIYVVGENTIKGTYIQNAKIVQALAEEAGLKMQRLSRRTLPPNRRYLPPPTPTDGCAALDIRMRREVIMQFVKKARTHQE